MENRDVLDLFKSNMCSLIGFVVILCLAAWILIRRNRIPQLSQSTENAYQNITPLPSNWQEQDHIKIRNFKDIYHLTMGLHSCSLDDLVLMDNTYVTRIRQRRQLIAAQPADIIGFNPVAAEAVTELYLWLFSTYLPRRFPTAFIVEKNHGGKKASPVTRNLITGEAIPLDIPCPTECLSIIGSHVDCDFSILLPIANPNAKPFRVEPSMNLNRVAHLHAFILAFPSGFSMARKLGLPLAGIHGPVPGYSARLEKSMNRYFANLPFGKVVQRSNWSISIDSVLFKLGEMHTDIRSKIDEQSGQATHIAGCSGGQAKKMAPSMYTPSEEELKKWRIASETVDPIKCSLRMERQTLHRLEKTGALVFGFKTFLEPLSKVKEEGSGPQLAKALDGLRLGSVPAMDVYKDGVIWREPLIEYLNS